MDVGNPDAAALGLLITITLEHFHRFLEFIGYSAHTYDEGAAAVAESLNCELREEMESSVFDAITLYSASIPLEKKNDRFGANSSMFMPRLR